MPIFFDKSRLTDLLRNGNKADIWDNIATSLSEILRNVDSALTGTGGGITDLPAEVLTGEIDDARLSDNVALWTPTMTARRVPMMGDAGKLIDDGGYTGATFQGKLTAISPLSPFTLAAVPSWSTRYAKLRVLAPYYTGDPDLPESDVSGQRWWYSTIELSGGEPFSAIQLAFRRPDLANAPTFFVRAGNDGGAWTIPGTGDGTETYLTFGDPLQPLMQMRYRDAGYNHADTRMQTQFLAPRRDSLIFLHDWIHSSDGLSGHLFAQTIPGVVTHARLMSLQANWASGTGNILVETPAAGAVYNGATNDRGFTITVGTDNHAYFGVMLTDGSSVTRHPLVADQWGVAINHPTHPGTVYDVQRVPHRFVVYEAGAILAKVSADASGTFVVLPQATGTVGVVVQGFAGATADLQQWNVNGGSPVAKVTKDGAVTLLAALTSVGPATWSAGAAITAASYQVGRNADATNLLAFNVPTGAGFEWTINDVALMQLSAGNLTLAGALTWPTGTAVTAGDYQITRDADGTNQLHLNVPTGASFEFSINDVAKMTLDQYGTLTAVAMRSDDIAPVAADSFVGSSITPFGQGWFGRSITRASATNMVERALSVASHTLTLTGSTNPTGAGSLSTAFIGQRTVTDASSVTVGGVIASLYIAAAPLAAGSVTLSSPWAFYVADGACHFGATVDVEGALSVGDALTANSADFSGDVSCGALDCSSVTSTGVIHSDDVIESDSAINAATGFNGPHVFTPASVSGTSQAVSMWIEYIPQNGSLTTFTLPATAAVGDRFAVTGYGSGKWKIAQNASQTIHTPAGDTTTGTGGHLDAANRYDSVEITCVVANTDFVARVITGSPTRT